MSSSYFTAHPLFPDGMSLLLDAKRQCLLLLGTDKHTEQYIALSHEELVFLAELFSTFPAPIERSDELMRDLLPRCTIHLKVLGLAIETVSPGSYRLARLLGQEGIMKEAVPASPHPRTYTQWDWCRGMLNAIPPFLF